MLERGSSPMLRSLQSCKPLRASLVAMPFLISGIARCPLPNGETGPLSRFAQRGRRPPSSISYLISRLVAFFGSILKTFLHIIKSIGCRL